MKMLPILLACNVMVVLTACKAEDNNALSVGDAYAYAPLTATSPGVAYFTLTNSSDADIAVSGFASDCFASVELHRSVTENGIARMESVSKLIIEPGSTVRLAPGGLHLMLRKPGDGVAAGSRCQVTIHRGNEQTLSFTVDLLDRSRYQPAEPVK